MTGNVIIVVILIGRTVSVAISAMPPNPVDRMRFAKEEVEASMNEMVSSIRVRTKLNKVNMMNLVASARSLSKVEILTVG